jgi:hypothetical protein
MTQRTPAILLVTGSLMGTSLLAQPIFHDGSSPQVSFATAEVGRTLGSKRATYFHAAVPAARPIEHHRAHIGY